MWVVHSFRSFFGRDSLLFLLYDYSPIAACSKLS